MILRGPPEKVKVTVPSLLQSSSFSPLVFFVFYFVVLERRFRRDEAGRALRAPCDRVDVWEGFGWIRLVS